MKKRAAPAADSDFLDIIDDRAERGGAPDPGAPTWRLLIVDDEPEVHSATTFALKDLISWDSCVRTREPRRAASWKRLPAVPWCCWMW